MRGATAAARAHHVERSARQGDVAAVAVLRDAGEAARLAPESAALVRWGAAVAPRPCRRRSASRACLARAGALAAAGHFTDSHEALQEAIAIVPEDSSALCTTVVTTCAAVERQLGRYEQAHARLVSALRDLPEPASVESVELADRADAQRVLPLEIRGDAPLGGRAVGDAKMLGDGPHGGAGHARTADAMTGPTDQSSRSSCRSCSARG